jgi:hypothetical protein
VPNYTTCEFTNYRIWADSKKTQYSFPKAQELFSTTKYRHPQCVPASKLREVILEAATALNKLYGVPVEICISGEQAVLEGREVLNG